MNTTEITNACNNQKKGIIYADTSAYRDNKQDHYSIDDQGNIRVTHYKIVSYKNCDCFGCDPVLENSNHEYIIGSCSEFTAIN